MNDYQPKHSFWMGFLGGVCGVGCSTVICVVLGILLLVAVDSCRVAN